MIIKNCVEGSTKLPVSPFDKHDTETKFTFYFFKV